MPKYDFKCPICNKIETVTCKAADYSNEVVCRVRTVRDGELYFCGGEMERIYNTFGIVMR